MYTLNYYTLKNNTNYCLDAYTDNSFFVAVRLFRIFNVHIIVEYSMFVRTVLTYFKTSPFRMLS